MPGVNKEEIRLARQMTAIEYLKRYQPNRLKKSSARNEWELKDHDSFKINEITSKWHWKSRDIGGTSALNFLIYVDGRGFVDAVRELCGEQPSYIPPIVEKKERKPFVLPERNSDCKRVIRYLQNRGISKSVIEHCIQSEILYESASYHNAVFVGKDEKQIPKYAFLREIYDSGGKSFKMEQAGSEKAFGFCIPSKENSCRVAVYEACIDAMAHMTLENGNMTKYRLALGGISAPKEGSQKKQVESKKPLALEKFLDNHPEIQEIEICTDNDFAGRWACSHIKNMYSDRYRIIENLPEKEGTDYADLAKEVFCKGQEKKKHEVR